MGKAVQKLIVVVYLFGLVNCRSLADDIPEGSAFDVFENHAYVLEGAEEGGYVSVPGDGCVDAELCEELGGDVVCVGLHLSVDLELDDVWLLDYAFEEF